jgi:hypothetical protein
VGRRRRVPEEWHFNEEQEGHPQIWWLNSHEKRKTFGMPNWHLRRRKRIMKGGNRKCQWKWGNNVRDLLNGWERGRKNAPEAWE